MSVHLDLVTGQSVGLPRTRIQGEQHLPVLKDSAFWQVVQWPSASSAACPI